MTDDHTTDLQQIHDNLDTALSEIRHGSLAEGIDMVEIVRDQLAERLERAGNERGTETDEE